MRQMIFYLFQLCGYRSLIRLRSHIKAKVKISTFFKFYVKFYLFQHINKVKVTHQSEGHIMVKVKISTSLPILCSPSC